jgi:poly(A) polymerase
MMQPRFERRTGRTPFSLAEQPRFRAGFDFLRLRADIGEVPEEMADWWQTFSMASPSGREGMVEELRVQQQQQQRKKPQGKTQAQAPKPKAQRAPKSASAAAPELPPAAPHESPDAPDMAGPTPEQGADVPSDAPPKRRRRRRRKPSGGADAAHDEGHDGP